MTLGRLALAALLLAAACTRPLAPGEAAFAADLFGPALDLASVRVTKGAGLFPLPPAPNPPAPNPPAQPARRDPAADPCARVPVPGAGRGPPAAFVIGNRIHFQGRFYRHDTAEGWPGPVRVGMAMLLAHELTHVWQWQHRARTGYSPLRGLAEGLRRSDPYFHRAEADRPFLAHGYEQQASLLEDFVCHVLLDPASPRLGRLRAILAPEFPVDGFAGRREQPRQRRRRPGAGPRPAPAGPPGAAP